MSAPICEVCKGNPNVAGTLHRVNAKGVPGVWRCGRCLTPEQAKRVDPETRRLCNMISPPKTPRGL